MPVSTTDKRATFRKMHEGGCFALPNPYDVGSARALQSLGFKAIASTSAGFAWSIGKADNRVTLEDVLQHLTALCGAVDLPVNADFEGGFAHKAEKVAVHVAQAVKTGVAGLSIEDSTGDAANPLYARAFAIERIKAARSAIDASGQDVLLVARAEILLHDGTKVSEAIDKLVAFADAGADCLYAPGAMKPEEIAAAVKAIAPLPLNYLMWGPGYSVAELADMGVRRISVGSALAAVGWGAVLKAAEGLKAGKFDGLANGASGRMLNGVFNGFA
jgi:2-methylisocitrate lyase-like PEP mutase family enzyme